MSRPLRLTVVLAALNTSTAGAVPQNPCPGYDAAVEAGWVRYRAGDIVRADSLFARAHVICPARIGARVGLGYAALRTDQLPEAGRWFAGALGIDSADIDARLGSALVAVRQGDREAAVRGFEAVRRADPTNATAREYLDRLGALPPPDRPPLVLPDTTEIVSRARGDRFEVLADGVWRPFYVRGVNLGAALPGRFPSEFPDSTVYAGWIAEMAAMEANAIRLYTIHPPHFYQALLAHNTAHPDRALWLIHGVWTELPPGHDYRDREWEDGFFTEMRRVVDVAHGRADIPRRPGHAGGDYTADVSRWVLAYLIGREWEPFSVVGFNHLRPADTSWDGRYVAVHGASPMDAWLGRALDTVVAYETSTYRAQRPVGYSSWPTLDPMSHPTETTIAAEVALRRSQGEQLADVPREYDNDTVGLDATLLRPTPAFRAGVYAAFHVYPYYPDFIGLDSAYGQARSAEGPSNYFGYLQDLKAHHPDMPVLIAEYGVPASRTVAHLQPQGWHHGGHTEAAMAAIDARLTREIAEAGMAGGMLFAWIDEWFKHNWLVAAFEVPEDRNRLWLNRLDPEQMYGVIAMEPVPAVAGADVVQRAAAWRRVRPLLHTDDGVLRAAADAGALWLRFEPAGAPPAEIQVGFDVVDARSGAFALHGPDAPRVPIGLEVVVQVRDDTARVLLEAAVQQWEIWPMRWDFDRARLRTPSFAAAPPGVFTGRWLQEYRRPNRPVARERGAFGPPRSVINRLRFGRDGTEYAAVGYDRGILRPGPLPDGDWERAPDGALEIRVPWLLLNVSDPSGRYVLFDPPTASSTDRFGVTQVHDVRVTMGVRRDGRWSPVPDDAVARYSWEPWDEPKWVARRRPTFDIMRTTWRALRQRMEKEAP